MGRQGGRVIGGEADRGPDLGARDTWLAAWPGLLLACALLLPFLQKAHAVDDVTFLLQAKHVLGDPWHPTAFEMVADGHRIRLSSQLVTGPLMAWLLVPCVALGGAEWVAHLLQWLLVAMTIACTVRIGLRTGLSRTAARLSGLLVAGTPAVVGMATTSMSDVPAMAFAALGMERFLAWRAEGRLRQAAVVALALACAALARTHALAMPFVAAIACFGSAAPGGSRRPWITALPLAASLALAWLVMLATADPAAAHGTFLDALGTRGLSRVVHRNLAGFGCHWLLAVPLALPWAWARGRHLARDPWSWLVLVAAAFYLHRFPSPPMSWPLAIATALAFVVLLDVIRDAVRRGDRFQLLLGAWLLVALPAAAYEQLPCKFLLVSVPAAALLAARLADRRDSRLPVPVAGAVVAAGAALGAVIVLADAEFTDAGRQASRELIAPRVQRGEHVRFYGAWGAQWYAMQAGADVVAGTDPASVSGDVLVLSAGTPGAIPVGHAGLEPLGERNVVSRFGQVMSSRNNAGFYSNGFGYLPWTWRNDLVERILVLRVP